MLEQLQQLKNDWDRGLITRPHVPENLIEIIDYSACKFENEKNFKRASENKDYSSVSIILGESFIEACASHDIPFPYKRMMFASSDMKTKDIAIPFLDYYEKATREDCDSPYNLNKYKKEEILLIFYNILGLTGDISDSNNNANIISNGLPNPPWMKKGPSPFKLLNIDLESSLEIIGKRNVPSYVKNQLNKTQYECWWPSPKLYQKGSFL